MNRKGFLEQLTLLGAGTLVVPSMLFQSCQSEPRVWNSLSSNDIVLLNALGETILPKTEELLGAQDINIGKYVLEIVNACLAPEDKDTFLNGLTAIEALALQDFGKPFEKLDEEKKYRLLRILQDEAITFNEQQEDVLEPKIHYLSLLKELVVSGYFTSKEILREGFNYSPIPGRYQGCIDFDHKLDKIYKG